MAIPDLVSDDLSFHNICGRILGSRIRKRKSNKLKQEKESGVLVDYAGHEALRSLQRSQGARTMKY